MVFPGTFISKRLSLSEMLLLYPVMLLTCCQLIKLVVKWFLICFWFTPITFPAFCWPCANSFEMCCCHLYYQSQNELIFYMKWQNVSVSTSVLYVRLGIKYGFMTFANHFIWFLFMLYTASQLFWNWGSTCWTHQQRYCALTLNGVKSSVAKLHHECFVLLWKHSLLIIRGKKVNFSVFSVSVEVLERWREWNCRFPV